MLFILLKNRYFAQPRGMTGVNYFDVEAPIVVKRISALQDAFKTRVNLLTSANSAMLTPLLDWPNLSVPQVDGAFPLWMVSNLESRLPASSRFTTSLQRSPYIYTPSMAGAQDRRADFTLRHDYKRSAKYPSEHSSRISRHRHKSLGLGLFRQGERTIPPAND